MAAAADRRMQTPACQSVETFHSPENSPATAEEAQLYREAGAVDVGIQHLADTSPEAMQQAGGALAMLEFRP